jgi:fatty acid desaturase
MNWLIAHLVGDYILQIDWMAENKKKNTWKGFLCCFAHVFVYTAIIFLFTGWPCYALAITFVTHFALDKTMFVGWFCKVIGRGKFVSQYNRYPCATAKTQPNPFWPWSWVAVDNSFHLTILYFTDMLVKSV